METNAVEDPDLQIRGEGHGHPDPVIRGRDLVSKKFLQPFGPQFGVKITGGPGSPGPFSCICHCNVPVG